jgi:sugar/nucleoside kinase (ribokinase family)
MSVVVVGDVVTDIHVVHNGPIATGSDTPASIRVMGGGSAANTAAWLATTGSAVDLVAVVGRDSAGDERLAELTAAGVGCVHIRRSADAPTGSIVVLAHGGDRSFLTDRGANLLLVPSDVDSVLSTSTRHLHLSGYVLLDASSQAAGRHALTAARGRGLTTSVDMASAEPLRRVGPSTVLEWVRGVDILLANLEEARVLAGRSDPVAAARSLNSYARTVVVKLGERGSVWSAGGAAVEAPAVPADSVVDATGAGDAFAAGLLSAWLNGSSPAQCLAAGARLGAAAVGVVGGRPRH